MLTRVTRAVLESYRQQLAAMETALGLYNAIARLPERQFDVVILQHVLGYTTERTGQIMGVSEGTVRSHCFHARRKLAKELQLGLDGNPSSTAETATMRNEEPVDHSIDDLLSYAQIGERVTEEDIAASRRQIEREIAATIWQGALSCESSAHTANTYLGRTPSPDRTRPRIHLGTALHAQAAQDLRAISTLVIRDTHAAQHIAWLATAGRVEPEGALVFACLLHLAHRDEAAQWWWQFSAGAGSTTSALCLYLMHMQRGELRDADHWAAQAAELERLEMTTGRPAHRPRMRLHSWEGRWSRPTWMVSRTLTELHHDTTTPGHTPPGTGLLSRSLTAAVRRLKADCDEEIGEFLRPDAELAAQLQHSHS